MKIRFLSLILVLSCLTLAQAENREVKMGPGFRPEIEINDGDARIFLRRDKVYIVNDYDREDRVVITEEGDLIINGEPVKLNGQQTEMMVSYYDLTVEGIEGAKKIGLEGAKIGLHGAKIGMKAVAGVFRMILPSYDSDDLERDMERESEKIEAKAEKLEEKAELLDEIFDDLEDLHEDLRYEIPELDNLYWF